MAEATRDGEVVSLALDNGKILKFGVGEAKGVIKALEGALKKKDKKDSEKK